MIRLSHHLTPRVLEKREHLRRSQKGTAQAHVVLESEGATETQPSLSRGIPSLPRISSSLQQLLFSHSVMSDFCDPMDRSMSGFPVLHQLPQFAQLMSIGLVMPSNHLILCHPLLLVPSVFPSISWRVAQGGDRPPFSF